MLDVYTLLRVATELDKLGVEMKEVKLSFEYSEEKLAELRASINKAAKKARKLAAREEAATK